MSRIERENAEVLHVIETPLRMLFSLVKWVLIGSLALIVVLVNQLGWIVDLGDRSERGRDGRQNDLETRLLSQANQWSVFDVDFRTQPDPTDEHLARENRFWTDERPFNIAQIEDDVNWQTKAFTTTWIQWGGDPGEGIPYCTVALNGTFAKFYDATPGSWSTRGDDALDRKSARMQRDYEIAAMMTAALRSTLAHMKLHRPISEVFSNYAYCDADQAAHDPRYGVRGTQAYRSTLLHVNLAHAPVVRFRYVGITPESADTDPAHALDLAEVWGMCLPDSCSEGYGRGTTYFADIFASQAPLTDEQMLAENAMLAMTTEEFWEQAAQQNGITDMATIAAARKRAVRDLDGEFLAADFQI
jgi:hypothetical protein